MFNIQFFLISVYYKIKIYSIESKNYTTRIIHTHYIHNPLNDKITVSHCYNHKNQVYKLPIITALPFGSIARYCPGTMRRQPLFPNVS